jgi:hypothetical protein
MKTKTATPKGSSRKRDGFNDTSRIAQQRRLLTRLQQGPIDTLLIRQTLNIMHPGRRVQELRQQGHEIHTQRIILTDEHGRTHHGVALYTLIRLAKNGRVSA